MPIHRHHAYSTESFLEALEQLYEDVWVSRAILVCLNQTDADDYAEQLNRRAYSARPLSRDEWLQKSDWDWFDQCPNRILVVPYESLMDTRWEHSSWNLLIGVDVPSYKMDALSKQIADAHQRGFGEEHAEFHHLWFLH
jgi:hypothetical protein